MATKIVAGVLILLALASAGTVGVAYYNDPTMFDHSGCPLHDRTSSAAQPSSEPATGCCLMPTCEAPASAEAKP